MEITKPPKKQCVLVVGNGFSLGLVESSGLADRINLRNILPPPDTAEYLPFTHDRFQQRKLFDREIWPRLIPELEAFSGDQYAFFEYLAKCHTEPITDRLTKKVQLRDSRSLTFELKYYLWELFRYYDRIWHVNNAWSAVTGREWITPINHIVADFNLTVISFNYDIFFETLFVYGVLPNALVYGPRECQQQVQNRSGDDVVLLKPHGSLMYDAFGAIYFGRNPWLEGIENVSFSNMKNVGKVRYPVADRSPAFPDLVPPGHSEIHLADCETDVRSAVEYAIANADALILSGLSARSPDTAEVEGYLKYLRDDTLVLHHGRNGDEDNPAGQLLRKYSTNYRALMGGKADEVSVYLGQAFAV